MKLSSLNDRDKEISLHVNIFLNGEDITEQYHFCEVSEEESYALVIDEEIVMGSTGPQCRSVPEVGSPFGFRTRRLNGCVQILPKPGRRYAFRMSLAGFAEPIGEMIEQDL